METDATNTTGSLTLELCLFNVGPRPDSGPRAADRAGDRAADRTGGARPDGDDRDEYLWLAMTAAGAATPVVASPR